MRFNAFADIPTTQWLQGKAGLGILGLGGLIIRVIRLIWGLKNYQSNSEGSSSYLR